MFFNLGLDAQESQVISAYYQLEPHQTDLSRLSSVGQDINVFLTAILLYICLYRLLRYLQIRRPVHLVYFFYTFFLLGYFSCVYTIPDFFFSFWRSNPELFSYAHAFFVIAAFVCLLLFFDVVLELKSSAPVFHQRLKQLNKALVIFLAADLSFLSLTGDLSIHHNVFTFVEFILFGIALAGLWLIAGRLRIRFRNHVVAGTGLLMIALLLRFLLTTDILIEPVVNDPSWVGQFLATVGVLVQLSLVSLGLENKNDVDDAGRETKRDAGETTVELRATAGRPALVYATAENLSDQEDDFLKRLRQVLDENMSDTDFGIPQLCRVLSVSRSQLHQKVKRLTGKSTSIYIRFLRLEKAKSLLADQDRKISEVAYEVGFKNPVYFTQVFTQEFGVSPSSFRNQQIQ